jgi:nicotinate phosphoribosyltransferase
MTTPPSDGSFVSGPLVTRDAALFADLYELTMAASYFREDMRERATFSMFVRTLPADRGFLVAAGLDDVLEYLASFGFSPDALRYLDGLKLFDPAYLHYLSTVRFTGEVRAVPEGTVVFPDEPVLEVTAPLIEAQLVETAVMNICHLQTVLASKAARVVLAARGKPVIDFGLRRTHGVDAGLKAARCSHIAGAVMTSNVLAAQHYGIPPSGTMAHAYITAFAREIDAFRAYARAFPDRSILLIDTYDTIAGARNAAIVARELAANGHRLTGVRIDSGDVLALSREVRRVLDDAGCRDVRIFVSGGLDELAIDRLLSAGAPIDAFGVGTRMNVSADAPYVDMAYKLVRYDSRDVSKLSPGKQTWPGEKQVYRRMAADGRFTGDVLALRDEPSPAPDAEPLLIPVMSGGRLLGARPSLDAIRQRCTDQLGALPEGVRRLAGADRYPVAPSDALVARQRAVASLANGGPDMISRPPVARSAPAKPARSSTSD